MRETNRGTVWTRQSERRLVEIMAGDPEITYKQAAELMSSEFGAVFTKNSCIGKGRKLGIPPRLAVAAGPITINQLEYRSCRWPLGEIGDRPPYMYCGLPVVQDGCSWCQEHFKRAHTKAIFDSAKTSYLL